MTTLMNDFLVENITPVLTHKQRGEMLDYLHVYEKHESQLISQALAHLKEHPVFSLLIKDTPQNVLDTFIGISNSLQKNAIRNDAWKPFVEYQIEQGLLYSNLGLDFKSCYELVSLCKNYIVPFIAKEYGNGNQFVSALNGMNCFLDITMGIIGEAFLHGKNLTIREEKVKLKILNQKLKDRINELFYYKYALDKSSIIVITDQKGIIKEVNTVFCKISKYSKEELIGQDHRILNSGFHSKEFIRNLWVTIANGKVWHGEIKNKAKDGSFYWVDTTIVPFLNSEGKPFEYIAIRSDITERKKGEVEIQELNNKLEQKIIERTAELDKNIEKLKEYQYFFLNSHDCSSIANMDGYFVVVNPQFEKVLGYSEKELVENQFFQFIHPDDIEATVLETEKLRRGALTLNFANRYRKKDGSYLWFEWNVTPDLVHGKLYAIARDITLRKDTEEQLLAVNKELESFSYSVSHDLRAPLRAVNGYAQMLEEDFGSNMGEESRRIVNAIKYNSAKMGVLIDDLLAFSRLGRKEIQKSLVDMNLLTEGVLNDFNKTVVHHANIKINKLHSIHGDYSLLHQVLFNLISNAVKYSSKKEHPEIIISSELENNEVVFCVKDNGVGFDMQFAHKLFGVFQRLHKTSDFEGTGVGLAIVQRVINKHGGRIWVAAEVNKGAAFYFTLSTNSNI